MILSRPDKDAVYLFSSHLPVASSTQTTPVMISHGLPAFVTIKGLLNERLPEGVHSLQGKCTSADVLVNLTLNMKL